MEHWLARTRAAVSDLVHSPPRLARRNISHTQFLFLRLLRSNPNIIVKPADKNLGLTLLDRNLYDREVTRQLSDRVTYRRLSETEVKVATKRTYNQLTRIFQSAVKNKRIPAKISDYIAKKVTPDKAIIPTFYGLPKVHKLSSKPLDGTPLCPPCRPIVPGHSWITTPASTWLDDVIQPYARRIPTVTPDSTTVINRLEQLPLADQDCVLMTADVASLYTNIPTDEGIRLLRDFLTEFGMPSDLLNLVISVLRIVLTNNYFHFGGEFFLQLTGTAMGTPVAVVFANIFMFMIERTVLKDHASSVLFYVRFLDDILALLKKQGQPAFVEALSNRHPNIKLDVKLSSTSVDFLDLRIHKGPRFAATGIIDFSVHQKQLNAYLYLPFFSFHAPRSKGGFMVTELMRYVRNSSSRKDYIAIKRLFLYRLRARGYPAAFLHFFLSKVSYSDRPRLLQRRPPPADIDSKPTVFFTTEYNSSTHKLPLAYTLHRYLYTYAIDEFEPMVGLRRSHNLHNLLCSNNKSTPEDALGQSDPASGPLNPNNH
ncbi:MAG: reverse transcriptase domain-containing protein [Candidatus Pacebacteria bacterium]|nr:reverse transcriptase domain-containing protein [Candidatus Paceibacterota bacterium]